MPARVTFSRAADKARASRSVPCSSRTGPRRARSTSSTPLPTNGSQTTSSARADDVVWDPFVGSGVELVERARLGPVRELHGTDLDARALSAARENVTRAGISGVELQQADARNHRISGLSLVLTN